MKVKIVNTSRHPLPSYATPFSAGMDLHASLEEPVTLAPMQRALIPTGIRIELPAGYEAQIRPRSGLAIKHGITVLNTPGTIDADYRGEICAILANTRREGGCGRRRSLPGTCVGAAALDIRACKRTHE